MSTTLEQTAMQWVDDEVRLRSARKQLPDQAPLRLQLSPVAWVLPKLLRIVYQNTAQPVEVLGPLIRTMLHEQAFANTGGDPVDCERLEESIDETVGILVRVLERVRRHCLDQAQAG